MVLCVGFFVAEGEVRILDLDLDFHFELRAEVILWTEERFLMRIAASLLY